MMGISMKSKLVYVAGTVYLHIPAQYVRDHSLKRGDFVEVREAEDQSLIIMPGVRR